MINYLDQAAAHGIRVDSQILGHCSGVRFRDFWLDQLNPTLQRAAQGRSRYPSFYGFNYNDEMFFGQWVTDWTPSDVALGPSKKREPVMSVRGEPPEGSHFFVSFLCAFLKLFPSLSPSSVSCTIQGHDFPSTEA